MPSAGGLPDFASSELQVGDPGRSLITAANDSRPVDKKTNLMSMFQQITALSEQAHN